MSNIYNYLKPSSIVPNKVKCYLAIGLLSAVFLQIPFAHAANPTIKTNWKYYNISGSTSKELIAAMRQKGPNGFWAFARWSIRWTGKCQVSLKINYTLPRWKNKNSGPKQLQANWNKMVAALKKHEQLHGLNGINAAKEIVKTKCKNGDQTISKWANQDKVLDRKTDNGQNQGVVLP